MRSTALSALLVSCVLACSSSDSGSSGAAGASASTGGGTSTGTGTGTGAGTGGSGTTGASGNANGTGGIEGSSGSNAGTGGSAGSANVGVKDGGATMLPRPSSAAVMAAINAPLSSYHRTASTGDIWCTPCDGAPVMLAAAAYAGDTSVDTRLLQQMREVLAAGKNPFATGTYAANDERNATAMYAIAKRTPRIWSQLSMAEMHKIDLIMEATLVADVYLIADKTNVASTPPAIDGDTNFNRDWNPNYREGSIGAVIVSTEYFGGQQPAEALLAGYDHVAFTADLMTSGLDNTYWAFNTYKRDTTAGAPSPQMIQDGIKGFVMHGMTLGQLLDMYVYLVDDTFSATVGCGLNNGAGIPVGNVVAGRITAGCAGLPNVGAVGMEKEFDSVDAEGKRSDGGYVRLGVRDNLFNQLVLVVYGDWKDTTASTKSLTLVGVGVTDFFYKAMQGYESYSHAKDQGLFKCGTDIDCTLNQAIWTEILAPSHGL